MVYADDVNMLVRSINTIKENARAWVVPTKEIGLDVNADKTKYMIMSWDQNAGRSHSMKNDNSSFERVGELKYLGTYFTNQNYIHGKKLRADWSHRILAIIRCRIFCLPVCYPKIQRLTYKEQ